MPDEEKPLSDGKLFLETTENIGHTLKNTCTLGRKNSNTISKTIIIMHISFFALLVTENIWAKQSYKSK